MGAAMAGEPPVRRVLKSVAALLIWINAPRRCMRMPLSETYSKPSIKQLEKRDADPHLL